ncbi:hypothetical protein QSJ19_19235, partial [Gordonia sp. ABSL11-1]|uniref:hypothetical protein n=1 Tax=Gordonia sp. ABSL11-1 TaxID=3053924 RepID=UPI0025745429
MGLLTRCAQTYMQSDDNGKRLANQAFFKRIYIGEEDEQPTRYSPNRSPLSHQRMFRASPVVL